MSSPARRSPTRENARSSGAFAIAVGVHVLALLFVPEFRASLRDLATTSAEFVEVEAEPVPEPTPPPEAERPEPTPRERTQPTNVPPPETPPQAAEAPPPEDEAVEDLTGVTLTGSGSSSFSVSAGSGVDSTRPIESGRVTGQNTQGTSDGVPGGTGNGPVNDADLTVRAAPPSGLSGILQSLYPRAAEQQGIEGRAVVAVEVRADGTLGRLRLKSESVRGVGFGDACLETLRQGGSWTPARDRAGNPVTTVRDFPCRFTVNR